MDIISLDFGGSEIRLAALVDSSPNLISRLQIAPIYIIDQKTKSFEIVTLKRILDFDRVLSVESDSIYSIDYLAKIICKLGAKYIPTEHGTINCVVSVPSCFSQRQRSATRTAVQKAGFQRVRLVVDDQAIILSNRNTLEGTVLVYSWGATAFSVSLFELSQKGFQVIEQESVMNLGSDKIDFDIMKGILCAIRDAVPNFSYNNSDILSQILEEAGRIKSVITSNYLCLDKCRNELNISIYNASLNLPVAVYQNTIIEMFEETIKLTEKVLAGRKPDTVLLNGKMTDSPYLRDGLESRFGHILKYTSENDVAFGALLYAKAIPEGEWQKVVAKENEKDSNNTKPIKYTDEKNTQHLVVDNRQHQTESWADIFIPYLNKAQKLYLSQGSEKAIYAFEELYYELNRFYGEIAQRAALEQYDKGNVDKALEILEKAKQRDVSNNQIVLKYANICYKQGCSSKGLSGNGLILGIKYIDKGISLIELTLDGEKAYAELLAQLLYLKAHLLCELGETKYLKEAKELVLRCIRLSPNEKMYQEGGNQISVALKKKSGNLKTDMKVNSNVKLRRNDRCPCGSGKKYKKCCGGTKKR